MNYEKSSAKLIAALRVIDVIILIFMDFWVSDEA